MPEENGQPPEGQQFSVDPSAVIAKQAQRMGQLTQELVVTQAAFEQLQQQYAALQQEMDTIAKKVESNGQEARGGRAKPKTGKKR